jgi:alanyl-tRNA synthetase
VKQNQMLKAIVTNREEVSKHHSATHLLQYALKKVLGGNISQAGSLNDSTRLRFDFTYAKAMSKEQLDEVENIVNDMILNNLNVNIQELDIQEARKKGAIAMFGEKYGDVVRVVDFEGVSVEFCGGTHVKNTAQIGSFYITSEKGVSAGVRRIEAVCGKSAYLLSKSNSKNIENIENSVKSKDIISSINKLKEQIKTLKSEVQMAQNSSVSVLDEENINGVKVVVDILNNGDLKAKVDDIKNANEKVAIFLLQAKDDKVMMVSGIKGVSLKAGDWIKNIAPIVKGGGGGRADFAQAGGKDITKIQDAKEQALKYAKENLK